MLYHSVLKCIDVLTCCVPSELFGQNNVHVTKGYFKLINGNVPFTVTVAMISVL